ncbi:MAG: acetamidase/formamidase family protein [Vicinamibacterales bacterium]
MPGDMLEIEILDLTLRTPFGMNSSGPASGVLGAGYPATRDGDPQPAGAPRVIPTGTENGRAVAYLTRDARRAAAAVHGHHGRGTAAAVDWPARHHGGRRPDHAAPGAFGGNLDYKDLTTGAKLFLPVFHQGAQFYVGDPHSVQGDGEVNVRRWSTRSRAGSVSCSTRARRLRSREPRHRRTTW